MEYNVIYTNRRTIELRFTQDGRLEVRCNKRTSKKDIEEFVKSKEKWINKHKNELKRIKPKPIAIGSRVLYLGEEYEIRPSLTPNVFFDGEAFYVGTDTSDEVRKLMIEFYRTTAKQLLPKRVEHHSKIMGLFPNKVTVTSAITRWGSCSSKDNLSFPWRLVMADSRIVDYVIVHELAHIKEKNHSSQFWGLVEEFIPNYKERKNGLRQLEQRLQNEKW